jgi:hypothetical protein
MTNKIFKDQAVKVLCYNFKTKENEWQDAIVLNTISATDRPYRVELRLSNGIELKGYEAAAPECVKPCNEKITSKMF